MQAQPFLVYFLRKSLTLAAKLPKKRFVSLRLRVKALSDLELLN
jgi:hypothetical protein